MLLADLMRLEGILRAGESAETMGENDLERMHVYMLSRTFTVSWSPFIFPQSAL